MKTELSIYLDYRRALAQASSLEKTAAMIREQIDSIDECTISIDSAWQGEDAEKYIGKAKRLMESMEIIAKNTYQAAVTVREVAERTYQAEQAAIRIATMRTYR